MTPRIRPISCDWSPSSTERSAMSSTRAEICIIELTESSTARDPSRTSSIVFSAAPAGAQGTIKIMYTDPLSGPFAQVGDQNLQQFKYIIDYINGRGGALGRKFELVSFDNKSQPSEALLALKAAETLADLYRQGKYNISRVGLYQRHEQHDPAEAEEVRRRYHLADRGAVEAGP